MEAASNAVQPLFAVGTISDVNKTVSSPTATDATVKSRYEMAGGRILKSIEVQQVTADKVTRADASHGQELCFWLSGCLWNELLMRQDVLELV